MTARPALSGRPGRTWRLSQVQAAVLYLNTLLTFVVVSAGVLLWRLPALDAAHLEQVEQQARQFVRREEVLLLALERQLLLVASALGHAGGDGMPSGLLDAAVGDGGQLQALAVVAADGRVQALGLPPSRRAQRAELLGVDLSSHHALQRARARQRITWGSMSPTALSPASTLSLVLPLDDGRMLWAEVALTVLLASALEAGDGSQPDAEPRLWVVGADGEVMADSQGARAVGRINLLDAPWMQQAVPGRVQTFGETRDGMRLHVAVVRSAWLDWTFVAALPAGLDQREVRDALLVEAGSLAGALLIGLVLAPLVSRRLVHWLQAVVVQAREPAAAGGPPGADWRPTPVREFNLLAGRLGELAGGLRERERHLRIIFDAAPVAMAVTRMGPGESDMVLQDVNAAWCQQLGHERGQVLGRSLQALGLWADPLDGARAHDQAGQPARRVDLEARLRRADGSSLQCHVTGRGAFLDQQWLVVWGMVDVSEQRRIEQALRELNLGLEDRVARRTQDLVSTNAQLRGALDHLQHAQQELLRAEKLAALGDLVAGVAHELGTPLGNSLMAVSTLADEVATFRRGMQDGLRRSALEQLLDSADQATAISQRNLHRAANLVTSFKQVAVDQASAQRRHFSLDEMVRELLLTLKPSFNRTPYTIELDVAAGLTLDSYPGALGRVLANLVNNARIHGFDGRDHGRIVLRGRADGDGWITLEVEDDGQGIAAALLDRVFDPFVTTRMGRGGTGLGLHIAHNAATRILGGTLDVRSTPGAGSCFTLRIPRQAPAVTDAQAA